MILSARLSCSLGLRGSSSARSASAYKVRLRRPHWDSRNVTMCAFRRLPVRRQNHGRTMAPSKKLKLKEALYTPGMDNSLTLSLRAASSKQNNLFLMVLQAMALPPAAVAGAFSVVAGDPAGLLLAHRSLLLFRGDFRYFVGLKMTFSLVWSRDKLNPRWRPVMKLSEVLSSIMKIGRLL